MHWAARFNNPKIVEVLFEVGVKSETTDSEMQTAMSLAAHYEYGEVVSYIRFK